MRDENPLWQCLRKFPQFLSKRRLARSPTFTARDSNYWTTGNVGVSHGIVTMQHTKTLSTSAAGRILQTAFCHQKKEDYGSI